ncbi:hypothetical protein IAQ61_008805 [Plenodomus lingam]|uniref:Predicted protein n=1 Tax=Leptosphaeria maculans (strain JN3 / isolate v23.1.3 / race Av1-4-5-6-7-8) TaxID=985895 RepID=E4ZNM2_LEPMJ|nr:predicted protein [Plenodomus lingam JN3]KAH9864860.1 hypothetical protein IAQ61_008805 [Plenodomus lingam]CBX93081.1 predicted protein [Plenodomus lingam JN3]
MLALPRRQSPSARRFAWFSPGSRVEQSESNGNEWSSGEWVRKTRVVNLDRTSAVSSQLLG